MSSIYLDHNATTPMLPEVIAAMAECARDTPGNPASQHAPGREARRRLEEARETICRLLGAQTSGMATDRLVFTSGGTEANNLALLGLVPQESAHVIVSVIEHPSVLGVAEELARRGHRVSRLRVLPSGVVDLEHLSGLLVEPEVQPTLVSVMLANNETGVIQPIAEVARMCERAGAILHTDASQAVGKIPVDFRTLGVAALTFAAHKFHGPPGVGGLLLRHDVTLAPILFGGFQQAGLRPGTESTALAVGMCRALQLWHAEAAERMTRMTELRDHFESRLTTSEFWRIPLRVIINGASAPRLPNTSNIAFVGLDRQALVMALDLAGVACSTGSACASGSSEPSPVLLAMGCPGEVISSSLRFSLGAGTTRADIDESVSRIVKVVNDLRDRKELEKVRSPARISGAKRV